MFVVVVVVVCEEIAPKNKLLEFRQSAVIQFDKEARRAMILQLDHFKDHPLVVSSNGLLYFEVYNSLTLISSRKKSRAGLRATIL